MSRLGLQKLLLAATSTLLTLLAVEVGVRLLIAHNDLFANLAAGRRPTVAPDRELELIDLFERDGNPRIVYHLRGGVRGRFKGASVEINALGHRGPESSLAKPPGVLRIVGLGDSVMFGWGVELRESFLALLAERFASPATPVEAVNLGVPGYNTIQEIEAFAQYGIALEPDLVVLAINENDLDLPIFLWASAGDDLWSLRRSFALSVLRGTIVENADVNSAGGLTVFSKRVETLPGAAADEAAGRTPETLKPLLGKANFLAALDHLRALSVQHGFRVIVVPYFPSRGATTGAAVNIPHFTLPGTGNDNLSFFLTACRERGFEIADPEPLFAHEREERHLREQDLWVTPSDAHPNPVAHRLIADRVEQVIRTRPCGLTCAAAAPAAGGPEGTAAPAAAASQSVRPLV